ncbi:GL27364 [Drosophila persimilis]|uniref:GL27364 n=1 Tax=Drosophila persimilis TaxID=7234 RepID=B4GYS5_DROPE|nr:GL27364 [Drosophila persimilis]
MSVRHAKNVTHCGVSDRADDGDDDDGHGMDNAAAAPNPRTDCSAFSFESRKPHATRSPPPVASNTSCVPAEADVPTIVYEGLHPSALPVHMSECALVDGCPLQAMSIAMRPLLTMWRPVRCSREKRSTAEWLVHVLGKAAPHSYATASSAGLQLRNTPTFSFDLAIDNKDFVYGNQRRDYADY